MTILYIIVPCYNEEEVLPESAKRLRAKLSSLQEQKLISEKSHIVFVDDGSKDNTWQLIEQLASDDNAFEGIKLSRNRGHQNALLAGLMHARELCDAVISIDADLQDDVDAIDEFIEKYNSGADIVYGVRDDRTTDSFFKRFTACGFYKLMRCMGCDIVFNHADYRLMSRRALDAMSGYKEVNLFLRGIVPELGFKTDKVFYKRAERYAGKSKYNLKKMLSLAFNGITSFSVRPIKLISGVGAFSFAFGIALLIVSLIRAILELSCSTSAIIGSLWLLAGLQLIAIGIVGEYIGKIYLETKSRPRYIIEKTTLSDSSENEDA